MNTEQEWIVDRLPTKEECSRNGTVLVPLLHNSEADWAVQNESSIKIGEPWAPFPKMPPYVPKKTPEEWFQELPESIRDRAVKNIDSRFYRHKDHPESLADAIYSSFQWDGSLEGFDYWENLKEQLKKGTPPSELKDPLKKEYWSKPEHFPATCYMMKDGCKQVGQPWFDLGRDDGELLGWVGDNSFTVDQLKNWRWLERPFSNFHHGRRFLVEGSEG